MSLSDPKYKLWEKEQFIVLLSRTHYAKDINFVSDPQETAEAMASLLGTSSQYSEYMCHIWEHLCCISNTLLQNTTILHPFHPVDVEIPSDYLGVVYVPLDNSGAWKFSMAKELKQAGMEVDLNKLI